MKKKKFSSVEWLRNQNLHDFSEQLQCQLPRIICRQAQRAFHCCSSECTHSNTWRLPSWQNNFTFYQIISSFVTVWTVKCQQSQIYCAIPHRITDFVALNERLRHLAVFFDVNYKTVTDNELKCWVTFQSTSRLSFNILPNFCRYSLSPLKLTKDLKFLQISRHLK